MTTYIVDFQSGGIETSPSIPGKTSISLPRQTVNNTSLPIRLTGQGTPFYGEIQQENFVRLLENFASKTAPANPTVGMTWFDTNVNLLKLYDINEEWTSIGGFFVQNTAPGQAVEGQLWWNTDESILYIRIDETGSHALSPRYHGGEWAQVWPGVVRYASLTEYNVLANRINKVLGPPTVDGTNLAIGWNQWGWNQSDLLPIFTDYNTPTQFDNNAWVILLARLMKATLHLDQSLAPIGGISKYGYIQDGRGHEQPTAESYVPSVAWTHGWGQVGIRSQNARYTSVETAIQKLEDHRFTMNTLDTSFQVIDTATRASWRSTKVYDASIQFTTENEAKRFFNTGGQLRFNISITGGVTLLNAAWKTLLTNGGTNVNDYSTAGFVIDFRGCKLGPNSTSYIDGDTSLGYYTLTNTFQTAHSVNRGGAYGTGSLIFEARTSTVGGWTVDVRITLVETYNPGDPTVDGNTTIALQVRRPVGAISGDPTINSPAILTPTATTSGTFKTAPAE